MADYEESAALAAVLLKRCKKCCEDKPRADFQPRQKMADRLRAECRKCSSKGARESRERRRESYNKYQREYRRANNLNGSEYTMQRRVTKKKAAPPWLTKDDKQAMKALYLIRRRASDCSGISLHVDHIVPLTSPLVCGLHVPWNLRIIPARQNIIKRNKINE